MTDIVSYRRLGLSARPLALYSSGGVEKTSNRAPAAGRGLKALTSRRSEGRITHNPDGTTAVIYAESDDEEVNDVPLEVYSQEETPVIKGKVVC